MNFEVSFFQELLKKSKKKNLYKAVPRFITDFGCIGVH